MQAAEERSRSARGLNEMFAYQTETLFLEIKFSAKSFVKQFEQGIRSTGLIMIDKKIKNPKLSRISSRKSHFCICKKDYSRTFLQLDHPEQIRS